MPPNFKLKTLFSTIIISINYKAQEKKNIIKKKKVYKYDFWKTFVLKTT